MNEGRQLQISRGREGVGPSGIQPEDCKQTNGAEALSVLLRTQKWPEGAEMTQYSACQGTESPQSPAGKNGAARAYLRPMMLVLRARTSTRLCVPNLSTNQWWLCLGEKAPRLLQQAL